jgi:Pyridoxamine 5'-phosphate oxidase
MALSDDEIEFLRKNRSAAMITVGSDGVAKAVRIGLGLVDGKLWSSGTDERARTRRLRRDPRCTLFAFEPGFLYLTLETTVELIDGPEAVDFNVRLFRELQGRPAGPLTWFGGEHDEDRFREIMVEEGRLIYQFEVQRSYGYTSMP